MTDKREYTFLRSRWGTALFLLAMALAGFLAQFQIVGIIVITLYAISMVKLRLPARVTFTIALLALGMVPVAILAGNWLIAQNFAAYAFVLFCWGVVALTTDLQREIHPKK